jgi:Fe-Mn family superoxide dismutase
MTLSRRQLLYTTGVSAAALAMSPFSKLIAEEKKAEFTLPKLPYDYDALQPSIDEKTMQIHHDKHHQAYVDNLNKAMADAPDLQGKSIEAILMDTDKIPEKVRQAIINNGGGHANHSMFWLNMGPKGKSGGGEPKGDLAKAIDSSFGSYAKFQDLLADAAMKRFGSGWAWLVADKGKLAVVSTANQDSPISKGQTPIVGVDVWEHAYYLNYQNRRADYVKAWWNVVNWSDAAERYAKAAK